MNVFFQACKLLFAQAGFALIPNVIPKQVRHIHGSHANWNNRTSCTRQTDTARHTVLQLHTSLPFAPLSLCVLTQDGYDEAKEMVKKYLKKTSINCETLGVNIWIIWFINQDMPRQPSLLLSCEKSSHFLSSELVMTWLNIIYDLHHELFTDLLINYVSLKCNISDYV